MSKRMTSFSAQRGGGEAAAARRVVEAAPAQSRPAAALAALPLALWLAGRLETCLGPWDGWPRALEGGRLLWGRLRTSGPALRSWAAAWRLG